MVCSRVVLGRAVGQIVFFWFPEDVELALGGAVLEPIEVHVNGFGTFLFNCSYEDATGGNIVSFNGVGGCGWPNSMRYCQIASASCALR